MIRLDGRVAIVTGAAQGIGAAIAYTLEEAGVTVVSADRAPATEGVWIETDLGDDKAIDRCLAETLDRFGRLDILVNCACSYADAGLQATRAEWHALLDVNLIGAAILTARAAERITSPGGVIVNIGSVGGKFGAGGRALYPASKAALMQFTRNAAVTLADRGIRVLSVSPAWTWSPALERMAGSRARADMIGGRLHPKGRVGDAKDVAAAVLFACSPMAEFMTGIDLPVDGGFSILGPDQGKAPARWFEGGTDEQ